jgi:hypothetical protein
LRQFVNQISTSAASRISPVNTFTDIALAQKDPLDCKYAHKRIKANNVDFYATQKGGMEYLDDTFPESTMVYNKDYH